jgi:protein-disulfide isomerase
MTRPELGSAPVPSLRPDDHVRGSDADPLLVVYGDFSCPRCAVAWERLRDAPVRLAFRHFALRAKHPRAVALARAAEAAGRQGAFWSMAGALWTDQGHLDDPHLWARCERLGLDLDRFETDRRDAALADRVRRDVREALRGGVAATPTLFAPGATTGHAGPPDAAFLATVAS